MEGATGRKSRRERVLSVEAAKPRSAMGLVNVCQTEYHGRYITNTR